MLFRAILESHPGLAPKLLVERVGIKPDEKFKIARGRYTFCVTGEKKSKGILTEIKSLAGRPPLSKYGIQSEINVLHTLEPFSSLLNKNVTLFGYTTTNTHKFKSVISSIGDIETTSPIVSPIKVDLNENDYK